MTAPRIAVLCGPNLWHVDDLQRAAKLRGLNLETADPEKLRSECPSRPGAPQSVRCAGLELTGLDALIIRSVPGGSLEQVVYRMDTLETLRTAGVSVINPPKAVEAAVDKYLCLSRIHEAGLPVPRTIVCENPDEALEAFDELSLIHI